MLIDRLEDIAQQFVDSLKSEFEAQGHDASGTAMNSFRHETELTGDGVLIKIFGADYTQYVNEGRNPGKLPPISAIEEWVKIRNIAQGDEARKAAWAIAKAIEREGTPTENAYSFSQNGRRKGFIEITKQEQLAALQQQIRRALIDVYRQEMINRVRNGINQNINA